MENNHKFGQDSLGNGNLLLRANSNLSDKDNFNSFMKKIKEQLELEKLPSYKNNKKKIYFLKKQTQPQQSGPIKPPPAVLTRMVKGVNGFKCQYNYLKTIHSLQELDDFRFEQQCVNTRRRSYFENLRMRCQKANPARGGCPFALLAWRHHPADQKQTHVYTYSEHNHCIAPGDKRSGYRLPNFTMWPDEKEPSRSYRTANGRQWTFLETMEPVENKFVNLLEKIKRRYHCYYRVMKNIEKRTVYRATFYCTTNSECNYELLAQRTDRGRYHVYASGKHTCLHGKKGEEEDETEEENEDEEIDDEQDEMDEDEWEEDEEEELEDEENKENEENNEEEEEDNEALPMAIDDDEANVVQFVDFVEHSGGVKMRRLGEPKEEPGHEDDEEEPNNRWQKMMMPKPEIKEEETLAEDASGPSNRGGKGRQPPQTNSGSAAAAPAAAINQQNKQQPVMIVRERWWAKENRLEAVPKNEKRHLRERKRRINYRE